MSWLAAKGALGLARGAWIAIVAALIAAAVLIAAAWFDSALDRAADAGATEAARAGGQKTLEQLGKANDAEDDLRRGGERSAERYAECMRWARTPANCERYRPDPGP
ncbi:hypothetical protein [Stakelama tenebrarum]|uniref:Uncharacterized protein n=1 Tax=Stakelama tenebrarum TaxID=2711215 RepID=A0A6G6Y4X4_9SPHN|nr:hypothetical protein [Sphingosinithalassobacter tenebrarum]QIG80004.1 hypothetical protein G5C33_09590 [Sphingosinithalassobacter tenebrarum]